MILAFLVKQAKYITDLICDERSRLLAYKKSVKIIILRLLWFSLMYFNPLFLLFNCHWSYLFKAIVFFEENSIDWAMYNRSKKALSWQIKVK